MELRLTPDLAAKLQQWSAETGRPAGELVEGLVEDYFAEIAGVRRMLESRYDDMASGRVQPISGEEAYKKLKESAAARRKLASCTNGPLS